MTKARTIADLYTVHQLSTSNPHQVTKTQVGLGNVDDTSDATKNQTTATLTNKTLTTPVINGFTGDTSEINIGSGQFVKNTSGSIGFGASPVTGIKLTVNGDQWWGNGAGTELGRLFNDSGVWHLLASSNVTGLAFGTNGTKKMTLNSDGNLGLGVTPSAWSGYGSPVIEMPTGGTLVGRGSTIVGSNFYYNGGLKYSISSAASYYGQNSGIHTWYTAPSGTAGNPITFTAAMSLDASGNLNVGAVGGYGAKLFARKDHNSAPVLELQNESSTGFMVKFATNGESVCGSISYTATTVALNSASDHRLKENVRLANAARFNDIRFVDFEWIDGRHDCGVVAMSCRPYIPIWSSVRRTLLRTTNLKSRLLCLLCWTRKALKSLLQSKLSPKPVSARCINKSITQV